MHRSVPPSGDAARRREAPWLPPAAFFSGRSFVPAAGQCVVAWVKSRTAAGVLQCTSNVAASARVPARLRLGHAGSRAEAATLLVHCSTPAAVRDLTHATTHCPAAGTKDRPEKNAAGGNQGASRRRAASPEGGTDRCIPHRAGTPVRAPGA